MEPKKPIYLTVEFYLALVSLIVGILVSVQMLTDDDSKFLTEKIGLVITNAWLIFHWIKQYRERQPSVKPEGGNHKYDGLKGPMLPLLALIALCLATGNAQAQRPSYKEACLFGCRCEQRDDPRIAEVLANQRMMIQMMVNLNRDLALRGAEPRPPAVRETPPEAPRLALPYEKPIRDLPREAPIVELPREAPKITLPREPGVREFPSESGPTVPREQPKVEILEFTRYQPATYPVWRPKR